MPAWIAGIQARKDASRNVLVNLDSSSPCWNDVIEGFLTEAPSAGIFKGATPSILFVQHVSILALDYALFFQLRHRFIVIAQRF
jgi:hypothetical protein